MTEKINFFGLKRVEPDKRESFWNNFYYPEFLKGEKCPANMNWFSITDSHESILL